jgi:hypothetical protein
MKSRKGEPTPKKFHIPKDSSPPKNVEQTSPWIFNLCASRSKIQIYRATLIWEINLEILRIERKKERERERKTKNRHLYRQTSRPKKRKKEIRLKILQIILFCK